MPEKQLQWNLPDWLDSREPEVTIIYHWTLGCGKPWHHCGQFDQPPEVEDIRYVIDGVEKVVCEDTPLWLCFEAICMDHELAGGAEMDHICDTQGEDR